MQSTKNSQKDFDSAATTTWLFAYGTLRTGESRHHLLAAALILNILEASAEGQLVALGEYPGMIVGQSRARVTGELIELGAFEAVREALDKEEGQEFRRERIRCRDAVTGQEYSAWTYLFVGSTRGAAVIASGDWLRR